MHLIAGFLKYLGPAAVMVPEPELLQLMPLLLQSSQSFQGGLCRVFSSSVSLFVEMGSQQANEGPKGQGRRKGHRG